MNEERKVAPLEEQIMDLFPRVRHGVARDDEIIVNWLAGTLTRFAEENHLRPETEKGQQYAYDYFEMLADLSEFIEDGPDRVRKLRQMRDQIDRYDYRETRRYLARSAWEAMIKYQDPATGLGDKTHQKGIVIEILRQMPAPKRIEGYIRS